MATKVTERKVWWKYAIVTVPLVVIVGNIIGGLSNSGFGNPWFDAVQKPRFMPPGWVFGVAWGILYTMLGISLALVLAAPESPNRSRGLTMFFVQLALNFAWSPVFFGLGAIDAAFIVVIAMAAAACLAFSFFWRVERVAGLLLLPYLAWLCLATALNYEIGRLNPGADRAPLGITSQ